MIKSRHTRRYLGTAIAAYGFIVAGPTAAQEDAVPAFKQLDSMEARVQGCVTCHGHSGQGTASGYFPRIAGKPAGYLYNQLVAFRDGTRQYPPMNYLVAYLPDTYLREMAEHFSKQRPPFAAREPGNVDAQMLARGQALVTSGDSEAGSPACVACHGAGLTGMDPGIPGLVGLQADLHRGAADALAGRGTARDRARLHEARGRAAVGRGHRRRIGLACTARTAEGPVARIVQPRAHALCVRQPTVAPRMRPAARYSLAGGLVVIAALAAAAFYLRPGVLPKPEKGRGGHQRDDPGHQQGRVPGAAGDCVACHTQPGGREFAGARAMPTPFGNLYVPNITPDEETGIGTWTAEEFYRMMHTGISRDGTLLYPAMPFASYTKVTREDSNAIFAYLMSVPPVKQKNRPHELRFPFNQRELLVGWRALYFREGEYEPDANQSAQWNRGAYLVQGLGHCAMCHTAVNPLGGSSESAGLRRRHDSEPELVCAVA